VAVEYTIDVIPPNPLIGEPITVVLRCAAKSEVRQTLTFDHRSLVIELIQEGLEEPILVFPNRYSVERNGNLLRLSSTGGVEDLAPGEERLRTFNLVSLFPERILNVGMLSVTYRLEESNPIIRPEPVAFEVASGPAAVMPLIERLNDDLLIVRQRTAELLTLMTARQIDFDADAPGNIREATITRWRDWWQQEGSRLPWSFDSDGASFGRPATQPPPSGRSYRLGGVAYPKADG